MQRDSLDPSPRLRSGSVEFPVHHVRGGTSTGLIISEHWAPAERELREELLRHLMGLPLDGTRAGNKQIEHIRVARDRSDCARAFRETTIDSEP